MAPKNQDPGLAHLPPSVTRAASVENVKAALGAAPPPSSTGCACAARKRGARISTAWRDPDGHRHEIEQLRRAVLASGGKIATIDRVDQVKDALAGILHELRGQYVLLSYYPSHVHVGGPPPKVDVRLRNRSDLDLRVHRGAPGK